MIPSLRVALVAALALSSLMPSHSPAAPTDPSPEARDGRMAWWREARFGMFIHWGLYAIPAGEWNGETVPGISEWIMHKADIPTAEYEALAPRFNPTKYDPDEWARIAKDAGVKYVVITSKHHDGFCLFGTAGTDWDVVDATPWGKDLLAPLAEACRREGLKFCTYYSIMDWHHPTQDRGPKGYDPSVMREGRKAEYVAHMKRQMKELLDSCDPDVLWFDGEWPGWWTEEDGRDMYAYLRGLKPSIIVNNRVGKGRKGMQGFSKGDREYAGDFGTPEQEIPATGVAGVDWESCMTMNGSWGYKKSDQNWKSAETLIRNIVDTASKGGNYLLNVGPTAEGEIPPESVERLAAVGRWMRANGESIYGTTASPVEAPAWGRYTVKRVGDNEVLYAHVFDWPTGGTITVPWPEGPLPKCTLLADGQTLNAQRTPEGVTISLPPAQPDPVATVVRIETPGE